METTGSASSKGFFKMDEDQINKWFEKGEWLNGWSVKPDPSINRKALALSYFSNREKWDKAFAFLKDADVSTIEYKKFEIDGEMAYAVVSNYVSKNEEDARYESHKRYIDIQYVFKGKELIGLTTPDKKEKVLLPYDPNKDIEFMTVSGGTKLKATPETFFIFFPADLHCPGMRDGENARVDKIVVKVKVD